MKQKAKWMMTKIVAQCPQELLEQIQERKKIIQQAKKQINPKNKKEIRWKLSPMIANRFLN